MGTLLVESPCKHSMAECKERHAGLLKRIQDLEMKVENLMAPAQDQPAQPSGEDAVEDSTTDSLRDYSSVISEPMESERREEVGTARTHVNYQIRLRPSRRADVDVEQEQ